MRVLLGGRSSEPLHAAPSPTQVCEALLADVERRGWGSVMLDFRVQASEV